MLSAKCTYSLCRGIEYCSTLLYISGEKGATLEGIAAPSTAREIGGPVALLPQWKATPRCSFAIHPPNIGIAGDEGMWPTCRTSQPPWAR